MKYSTIAISALLGNVSAAQLENLVEKNAQDTYDRDPDTTSMYDDLHTYVKPGSGAFAQQQPSELERPKKKKAKGKPRRGQEHLSLSQKADTYDRDPDTTSMYDDLHTYVKPGSGAFAQKADTYDRDPDTTSMYDDLHTYVKPGSGAFAQKVDRDVLDNDPDTVSEYDVPQQRNTPAWVGSNKA